MPRTRLVLNMIEARETLLQVLLVFLFAGSVVGVAVGIGMLVSPDRIVVLNRYFSRWIGTRRLRDQLDRPRWIERYFYRHHKVAGVVLFFGAAFVLYAFLLNENVRRVGAYLPPGLRGLWQAVTIALVIGGVVAVFTGAIVFIRPSLLRELEKAGNRWVSTESMGDALDSMNMAVDDRILRHRRLAGMFMLIGSIYVLIVLGRLLWQGI